MLDNYKRSNQEWFWHENEYYTLIPQNLHVISYLPDKKKLEVHRRSLWFTKIFDLVPSFPKVHGWSLWFALCNTFGPQLFPKLHGQSQWFSLCNTFSP
ncbi:hypothetical protein Hanom_Chr17g01539031 [Helianthus anomalus]